MSAQPAEPSTAVMPVVPVDPASPRGLRIAADLSEVFADVLIRLRAEGRPVPDLYADPAP